MLKKNNYIYILILIKYINLTIIGTYIPTSVYIEFSFSVMFYFLMG